MIMNARYLPTFPIFMFQSGTAPLLCCTSDVVCRINLTEQIYLDFIRKLLISFLQVWPSQGENKCYLREL